MIYSVRLENVDYQALERVATAWSVKRSDAFRMAIRVLAEAADAQARGDAPGGAGAGPPAPRVAEPGAHGGHND